MPQLTPFGNYLLSELRSRQRRTMFYSVPNVYYQIAHNQYPPTDDDFGAIATFLNLSVEFLMELYLDDRLAEMYTPQLPEKGGNELFEIGR